MQAAAIEAMLARAATSGLHLALDEPRERMRLLRSLLSEGLIERDGVATAYGEAVLRWLHDERDGERNAKRLQGALDDGMGIVAGVRQSKGPGHPA